MSVDWRFLAVFPIYGFFCPFFIGQFHRFLKISCLELNLEQNFNIRNNLHKILYKNCSIRFLIRCVIMGVLGLSKVTKNSFLWISRLGLTLEQNVHDISSIEYFMQIIVCIDIFCPKVSTNRDIHKKLFLVSDQKHEKRTNKSIYRKNCQKSSINTHIRDLR